MIVEGVVVFLDNHTEPCKIVNYQKDCEYFEFLCPSGKYSFKYIYRILPCGVKMQEHQFCKCSYVVIDDWPSEEWYVTEEIKEVLISC